MIEKEGCSSRISCGGGCGSSCNLDDVLIHESKSSGEETIRLDVDVLAANDRTALEVSRILEENGVHSLNVTGSVGSGKTTLIQRLIEALKPKYRITVISAEVTTSMDEDRISQYGVPVHRVNSGGLCHLDASTVLENVKKLDLKLMNLLIIENVGKALCPAEFNVGTEKTLVVTGVVECPYVMRNSPYVFRRADVIVINKIDLAGAFGVDVDGLKSELRKLNASAKIVGVDSKMGAGVKELINALEI